MKLLSTTILFLFTLSVLSAQPELTLWITPDGYHHTHNHGTDAQYFCDSNYYIFHHPEPDSVFVTLKNEGDQPLVISGISTQAIAGAHFHTSFVNTITLQSGEMHTVKVEYQLPATYVNGINGQLDISSNDPTKPNCTLYFDVGCASQWQLHSYTDLGVSGNCDAPVVYLEDFEVASPNFVYNDSMYFYTYDEFQDTSYPIMFLGNKGAEIRTQFDVFEEFRAGKLPNGSSPQYNFRATDVEVQITKDLTIGEDIDVGGNLFVEGLMQVNAITTPSDRRLKKDISNLNGVLNTMLLMRPTTYAMKDAQPNGRQQYGFIAQELEEILPELVHQDEKGQMSVNYLQIIPLLTAALQEQQKTIDGLEERLKRLEEVKTSNNLDH